MKKVAVVILNFKVKDLTIKCLQSVQKSTYQSVDIIVVDNDSQDGIGGELCKFKDVKFIQNKDNLGYAGGNNVGIKYALNKKVDYVFVLNPDTTIDKKAIENLLKSSEKESAQVSGPKIFLGNSKTIWYAGGIFDTENVLGIHRGVDEKDQGQYDSSVETDYITGAALFVSGEVFERVGLFDEDYFLYYEDMDFCLRVKDSGFKIMYFPQAVVYHHNAKSAGLV